MPMRLYDDEIRLSQERLSQDGFVNGIPRLNRSVDEQFLAAETVGDSLEVRAILCGRGPCSFRDRSRSIAERNLRSGNGIEELQTRPRLMRNLSSPIHGFVRSRRRAGNRHQYLS